MAVTIPTQIRIPDDVKEAARRRADADGTTISAVVTAFLRQYGDHQLTPPSDPEPRPPRP